MDCIILPTQCWTFFGASQVLGKGGAVSSRKHESFLAYDVTFANLVGRGVKPGCVSLDIGCRYDPHIKKAQPDLASKVGTIQVGWLHVAAGHNLECHLKYGGVFKKGKGRFIGENCEQLWVSKVSCVASCFAECMTYHLP